MLRLKRASGWGPSAAFPALPVLSGETAVHSIKARNRTFSASYFCFLYEIGLMLSLCEDI